MGVVDNNTGDFQDTATTSGFLNGHFSEMYATDHPSMALTSALASKEAPPEQLWDPHADFGGALSLPAFDSCLIASVTVADPMPTIPCFANAGFSSTIAPLDISRDCDRGKKRKNLSGCDAANSNSSPNKTWNDDPEHTKDSQPKQNLRTDGKKQRSAENPSGNARKPLTKQGKNGVDGKEDYIHVRAKRGQATNSHSLAERVRREKISERMRFLQNLVPGCNKITGKAVMLDEIINYVQSLQRQVEFLSMKLATVSPELNFDMMQLLTKDMLQSAGGCSAAVGFEPGTNYSMCHSSGFVPQPAIRQEIFPPRVSNPREIMRNTVSHVGGWDDGLHNSLQMAFVSHMSAGNGDTEPPTNQE